MITFTQAIAKMEGFYTPGSRPARNHNPGDLEFRPWQADPRFGGKLETLESGQPGRFTVFPDDAHGWAAIKHLLGFPAYRGRTVTQAINIWAPAGENHPSIYIANVCAWVGCHPGDVIDPLVEAS